MHDDCETARQSNSRLANDAPLLSELQEYGTQFYSAVVEKWRARGVSNGDLRLFRERRLVINLMSLATKSIRPSRRAGLDSANSSFASAISGISERRARNLRGRARTWSLERPCRSSDRAGPAKARRPSEAAGLVAARDRDGGEEGGLRGIAAPSSRRTTTANPMSSASNKRMSYAPIRTWRAPRSQRVDGVTAGRLRLPVRAAGHVISRQRKRCFARRACEAHQRVLKAGCSASHSARRPPSKKTLTRFQIPFLFTRDVRHLAA